MLSPRKLLRSTRFWIAVALLVAYTVFGFLVAPGIVSKQLLANIDTKFGRRATLRDVDINPYTFSARAEGFQLLDPDGEAFVTFDELFVDLQVSSLFRRAFTFKTVRLVSPHTHVRLLRNEKPNFQDMVDRLAAQPKQPPSAKPKKPPRLLLQRLEVRDMRLKATNLVRPHPEAIEFTPVDLTLEDFTTIPKRDGTVSLAATGPGGGSWEWTGTTTFEPMHSRGNFAITGMKLPLLWEVIRDRVPWQIAAGVLNLRLHYAVEVQAGSVQCAITQGALGLYGFSFRAKDAATDLLALDSLRVQGVELHFPAQTAAVQQIAMAGLRAVAWLDPSRQVNWTSLVTPPVLTASGVAKSRTTPARGPGTVTAADSTSTSPTPPSRTRAPAWKVQISEVTLGHGAAQFTDSTVTPPFAVELAPVDIVLRDLSSEPGAQFDLEAKAGIASQGTLALQGKVGALPPAADVQLQLAQVPLTLFQPYVSSKAKLELVSGDAGADGRLTARLAEGGAPPEAQFVGTVTSSGFLSKDAGSHERFLAWKTLGLKGVEAGTKQLHIAAVEAVEPYGRVIVFQDRHTNIDEVLMIPPRDTTATASAAPPPKPPVPIPTRIDIVKVAQGTADFADLSLILPFAAGIVSLNGEVRGLASEELSRANVQLDGGLVPTGNVHVRGQINPLSSDLYTDLLLQFNDFDLPALSPYSGQFLGRKVDQGKLLLDLQYHVAQRQLEGQNKIILDQLELGEKVESPEATSLPVGLAVALLKDRNGKIDLDLPVKGDLDDPKFSIWDAVFDVLRNIVVKLVTAPFALLGRLVGWGGDGEEMSQIYFVPGQHDLDTAEQEKVTKLAAALQERPQLRLEVRGSTNPEADLLALREAKFKALADAHSARDPGKYAPTLGGAGYSPRLFRDLYEEHFGKDGLAASSSASRSPRSGRTASRSRRSSFSTRQRSTPRRDRSSPRPSRWTRASSALWRKSAR